ncbi:MAG: NAD-dependent epimerase/dehydratase family protein [Acidimicrobiales bacterium]
MRILLTGSDGYLGSVVGPELALAGHDVVGLDTGFFREAWLHHDHHWSPATWRLDVRDVCPPDLEGFEAVVHLAELSNDPLGQLRPDLTRRINHHGSARLAAMARSAGVARFVYMSSCSVYGAADGVVNEEAPLHPQSAYAECKARMEEELHRLAVPGFSPIALRNATAFGLSARMRLDLVLNNLCALVFTTGEVTMTSDGTPWRPLVHALDIAQAIRLVLAAPAPSVHDEVINVGDGANNLRVADLARVVSRVFNDAPLHFGEEACDRRSYAVDFARIATVLPSFRCGWSVERGARQLRQAFELVGLSGEELTGRRYIRLSALRHLMRSGQLDAELRWRRPALDGCRSPMPALGAPSRRPEELGEARADGRRSAGAVASPGPGTGPSGHERLPGRTLVTASGPTQAS